MTRKIIIFTSIIIFIIAIAVCLWFFGFEKEIKVLYPELNWEEISQDRYEIVDYLNFCEKGNGCTVNEYKLINNQRIKLPITEKTNEYVAYDSRPHNINDKDDLFYYNFQKYYKEKLEKLGFINQGKIELPNYDGSLDFITYDYILGNKITSEYGKVVDNKLYFVSVRNFIDSNNIKKYIVHIVDGIDLSEIFKK